MKTPPLLLSLLISISAFAYHFEVGGIYYYIVPDSSNSNVAVTCRSSAFNSYSGDVVIPAQVTYDSATYTVTTIGNYAFAYSNKLTSVSIPNTVTNIDIRAFYDCDMLRMPTIPSSVEKISDGAFSLCDGIDSLFVPGTVRTISSSAFEFCTHLRSVTLEEGIDTIGFSVFNGCTRLHSLHIPASASRVGGITAPRCDSLVSITVDPANPYYDSRDNCNAIIHTASNTLLQGCKNTVIPDGITVLATSSFRGCTGLQSISIPETVTRIESFAFSDCYDLKYINIPSGVDTIYGLAFNSCINLESIAVNPANTHYDSRDNCNAIIHTASNSLIQGCKNTVIPSSVETIDDHSFYECLFDSIFIPEGVTSIERYAFGNCENLVAVDLPGTLTYIGNYAFHSYTDLYDITCRALTPPKVGIYAFAGYSSTLHVPAQSVEAYSEADTWREFNIEPIEEKTEPTNPSDQDVYYLNGIIHNDECLTLRLYATDGRLLTTSSSSTIDLTFLTPGIYVLTDAHGSTLKINHCR